MQKNCSSIPRREFIKSVGTGIAAIPLSGLLACDQKKRRGPNIILIQLDDLGWSDLGINGNEIVDSRHIDWLGRQSVRFSQFYVNPVCAPTRAALLTGRDFLRTGVSHVHGGKDYLHLDERTIGEAFKLRGYATAMWGKWHSGHTDGYYPWERGFDEAYMASLYKHRNTFGLLNGDEVEHREWADKILIDYAIRFMKKNRKNPFFCYISSMTCHEPLDAPAEYVAKYEAKGLSHSLATLYAMIEFLDIQLGRLFDYIKKSGLEDDTVILFMSDNGPAINNRIFNDKDRELRNVAGLKGHKGNIWENGVKSPLFIHWKDHYSPMTTDHLSDVTDIFPTLLDIADLNVPQEWLALDGISLKPVLEKSGAINEDVKVSFNYANPGWPPTDRPWTPEGIKDEYRPLPMDEKESIRFDDQIISIRKGRYKMLLNPGELPIQAKLVRGYALFDIISDPLEEKNLITKMPKKAEELALELRHWFDGIKSAEHSFQMPVYNIGYNGKMRSTVWAKGPCEISSGLKNAFNYLGGWRKTGDYAEYRIRVEMAGEYRVELHHDSIKASGAEVTLSIGKEKNRFIIDNNQTVDCGLFTLEKGEYRMRLEVAGLAPFSTKNVIDKLNSLIFIKNFHKNDKGL